jgi:hypothetical protein
MNKKDRLELLKKHDPTDPNPIDYSLFLRQEEDICRINEENFKIRENKFLKYGDSYWNFYKQFGLLGMVTDIYRKVDRLKNMSKTYTEEDITDNQKEIQDQYYDLINYCYLQLFFLRENYWQCKNNYYLYSGVVPSSIITYPSQCIVNTTVNTTSSNDLPSPYYDYCLPVEIVMATDGKDIDYKFIFEEIEYLLNEKLSIKSKVVKHE